MLSSMVGYGENQKAAFNSVNALPLELHHYEVLDVVKNDLYIVVHIVSFLL